MPRVIATQFVHDHHRLTYMAGKEEGYAFSVNTITKKIESACHLRPEVVLAMCDEWAFEDDTDRDRLDRESALVKPRRIQFKVTPLRQLPYAEVWNTSEMLPNAARAIWNKHNNLKRPIKCVTAYVEGGLAVNYRPWNGMGNPMQHCAFHAGFGGVWLPMKYRDVCPVFDACVQAGSLICIKRSGKLEKETSA